MINRKMTLDSPFLWVVPVLRGNAKVKTLVNLLQGMAFCSFYAKYLVDWDLPFWVTF